jgi:hypothetical protein
MIPLDPWADGEGEQGGGKHFVTQSCSLHGDGKQRQTGSGQRQNTLVIYLIQLDLTS